MSASVLLCHFLPHWTVLHNLEVVLLLMVVFEVFMEDHVMHFKTLNSAFRVWNEVVY